MGLWKKLKEWKKNRQEPEIENESWEEVVYAREDIDVHDKEQRDAYVRSCLEQIADASRELENLKFEYSMVTSYLKDMEEIEALPEEESSQLRDAARKIQALEGRRSDYLEKKDRMTQEEYHRVERMGDDVAEGIGKLTDAEDYQKLIRQDLKRLDGERHAYAYRRAELRRLIADMRGMAMIVVVSLAVCMGILLVLQFALDMDTKIGYLVTAGVAALSITAIFMKYNDSVRELGRVEKGINRLIMLQNRVKIRYVNNTNLLDYLYMRYQVKSAQELSSLWERYQEEKEERRKYQEAEEELDECQKDLLYILRRYQIKDPVIWLHQTAALLDGKEMVEIRHNLIVRRQSLRKRMDYNDQIIAHKAQEEIKDLVERYPQYAAEIMQKVGEYENGFE